MRRLVVAAVSSVAFSSAAFAQGASHVPSTVQAGSYRVEPGHTQVGFTVSHFGFSYYSGVFSNVSGALTLDPSKPSASRLSVTIPVASVQTTSAKLDGELKGPEWFDAAKYPDATFVSTSVTRTGHGTATVAGNFTLHGVTKPETLSVRFVGAGVNPIDKKYTVGFEATGDVKRSDFGVSKYVPYVGDDVRLTIAGAFESGSGA